MAHTHGPSCSHNHDDHKHDHSADKGHVHSHDHGHHHHGPGHVHGSGNKRAVAIGFVLTASFMVAEVIGGYISGSLALIADAGHMLTDAMALGLAWAGFTIAARKPDARRSFGYARFEVLAGFINALSLFAITAWIGYEAVSRIHTPQPVLAGPMLAVAVMGLLVNCLVFWILMRADRDHINIRGAILHVIGDLLGSVAAIVAALIIYATNWTPIDPILSIFVALLVLRSAWMLMRHSLHILLEGAPSHINVEELQNDIASNIEGVTNVHHVHIWSLSSGKTLATLHINIRQGADQMAILHAAQKRLSSRWEIGHATIQVELTEQCTDETNPSDNHATCA